MIPKTCDRCGEPLEKIPGESYSFYKKGKEIICQTCFFPISGKELKNLEKKGVLIEETTIIGYCQACGKPLWKTTLFNNESPLGTTNTTDKIICLDCWRKS